MATETLRLNLSFLKDFSDEGRSRRASSLVTRSNTCTPRLCNKVGWEIVRLAGAAQSSQRLTGLPCIQFEAAARESLALGSFSDSDSREWLFSRTGA